MQGVDLLHPFHLHGYKFAVLRQARVMNSVITVAAAMDLDNSGVINRVMDSPPIKDTVPIPSNGYAVIRFIADNPGKIFFLLIISVRYVTLYAATHVIFCDFKLKYISHAISFYRSLSHMKLALVLKFG